LAFGAGVLISAVAYELVHGIPESLVLGLTVLEAGSVSIAFLVAVFIANLPEVIAATAALEGAGRVTKRIMRFWVLVALGFALAFGISALD
jgi:ZIP family zinc transporter